MRIFLIIFALFFPLEGKSGTFSEVFGSEGAAGVNNPKTRSLSFTLQYLTLSGSIGYVGKQLYNTGFFTPFGLVPEEMRNISPIAYKDELYGLKYNEKLLQNKQRISQLNRINNMQKMANNSPFSFDSIEKRGRGNFFNSIKKQNHRRSLMKRYLNEK